MTHTDSTDSNVSTFCFYFLKMFCDVISFMGFGKKEIINNHMLNLNFTPIYSIKLMSRTHEQMDKIVNVREICYVKTSGIT